MNKINNLCILVVSADLDIKVKDEMFYNEFKNFDEVRSYLSNRGGLNISNLESLNCLYGINQFFVSVNEGYLDVDSNWCIPIFVEEIDIYQPKALVDKLEVNNSGSKFFIDDAMSKVYDECVNLIKENDNSVIVGDVEYSSEVGVIYYRASDDDEWCKCDKNNYSDLIYHYNKIKSSLDIATKVLNLSCENITKLMQYIGLWKEETRICEFSSIGKMILDANSYGYAVDVHIEPIRDYYVYGHPLKNGETTYVIYGISDSREEFEKLLNIDDVVKVIKGNKEWLVLLNDLVKEEKKK